MGRAEVILDDIDLESPGKGVGFLLAGRQYEIDLNEPHAVELQELVIRLKPYLEAAREVRPVSLYSQLSPEDKSAVRHFYKKAPRAKVSDDEVTAWRMGPTEVPEAE